jgi:hypothetical protein
VCPHSVTADMPLLTPLSCPQHALGVHVGGVVLLQGVTPLPQECTGQWAVAPQHLTAVCCPLALERVGPHQKGGGAKDTQRWICVVLPAVSQRASVNFLLLIALLPWYKAMFYCGWTCNSCLYVIVTRCLYTCTHTLTAEHQQHQTIVSPFCQHPA